jgi:putative DNA primase/helicase
VKGLLCHGEGSNGKDTLRAVLAAVFGRGMTGKSLSDFKAYDMGRKFNLAGIEGSICNWASENTAKVDFDSIQSLKQLLRATRSTLSARVRTAMSTNQPLSFLPTATNCHPSLGERPPLMTAMASSGLIRLTSATRSAAEGHLEADPRFKG